MVGNAFQGGRWGQEEVSSAFRLVLGEPFEVKGAAEGRPVGGGGRPGLGYLRGYRAVRLATAALWEGRCVPCVLWRFTGKDRGESHCWVQAGAPPSEEGDVRLAGAWGSHLGRACVTGHSAW